ncbi:hypothetical protein HPB47_006937 [Ixodes persulcatus]|uniref:Uncharacterized protein n=1 Tax=Ixodes persulcatus TaxID=34615 RepID=A0AC60P9X6_IXOPE|nr:hypothetical protein HPB47_006937 [Ixodes persulcatus]
MGNANGLCTTYRARDLSVARSASWLATPANSVEERTTVALGILENPTGPRRFPSGRHSKFNVDILQQTDDNGDSIVLWCRPGEREEDGYCIVYDLKINCSQHGVTAVKRHSQNSKVAKDFFCSRKKASYVVSDGLGPYFESLVLKELNQAGVSYSIAVDETPLVLVLVTLPRMAERNNFLQAEQGDQLLLPDWLIAVAILAVSQQLWWMWQTPVLLQVALQLDRPRKLRQPEVGTP